jgi:hypothetical protein
LIIVTMTGMGKKVTIQSLPVYILAMGGCNIEVSLLKGMDNLVSAGRVLFTPAFQLCLEVEDITQALAEWKARRVRLVDETAQVLPGHKMAFIHSKATGGGAGGII